MSVCSSVCSSVCLSVCMLHDHGHIAELNDVIFGMLTLMIPRSIIGYVIFTSLFIKGQYRSKMIIKENLPKSPKTTEVQ